MADLGTFVLASESRRAKSAAVFAAALVVCAVLGAAAALGRLWVAAVAPIAGAAAFAFESRRRDRSVVRGDLLLEGDVLLLRRKDQTIFRVPLADAKIGGRTLRVGADQWARVQVVVEIPETDDAPARAIVAKLAVPFRPGAADVEGPLPPTILADRQGSRTFDALHDLRKRSIKS
ncbi:MAG: hypothetical protein HYV09_17405 [Deltaproteobacteria bacterium]|nr:hypothetical protein [Deltaproteobacteria bacterium]